MPRITLDVSIFTYQYIASLKEENGSSISFEAVRLLEQAIKERQRKKKKDVSSVNGNSEDNPA